MQCYLSGHSDGSLDSELDPSTECSGSSINDTSTVSATDTNNQQQISDTTMMSQRRVSLRDTRERSRDRDSGILEDSTTHHQHQHQHQPQKHPNTNNNGPSC